ncbi:SWIM zinc finger family protein [Streptomyces zagrosensis]|uniref:SWIM-type domain-containing protein n=1 Tax=Streptomyces zagrosensis TaxID=1042984 RepID=A0A7W9UXA7_9ACTN|nr:SWIM zinc finger family protein [Streptomyces zagrosensis]MBB5934755.1 hypothetical protein [Streptomyces zagrosensis]
MDVQGERWTAEQVLALAPDASSQKAGSRLATPAPWSGSGTQDGALWGLCAGSGTKPYQAVIDLTEPAYRCSCPSRKFPCKHALGLLLLWAAGDTVREAVPPPWADEWLSSRRQRAERVVASAGGAGADGMRGPDDAGEGTQGARGDAPARRRTERVEQRERRIAAGATELEQRLADLLRDGLAGADRSGYTQWDETAARMVDAQAPGLASRARELGTIASSGPDWPSRLLEECALLHLLTEGFLRVADLPAPLAATARTRIGLTTDTAELLATADPVRDHWLVLARQDSDDGKLTTRRVWLRGSRTGRMAMLLSFGAAGRAPELALPVGLVLDADLAYYPAARLLRATLGTCYGTVSSAGPQPQPQAPAPEDRAATTAAHEARETAAPATRDGRSAVATAQADETTGQSGPGPSQPSAAATAATTAATRADAHDGVPAGATVSAPPGVDVSTALAAYGTALRDDPWLDAWPVILSRVVPIPDAAAVAALATTGTARGGTGDGNCAAPGGSGSTPGGSGSSAHSAGSPTGSPAGGSGEAAVAARADAKGWQLADADTGLALPIDPRCPTNLWQLASISGGAPLTVFGECGHRGFVPLTAWDETPVSLSPGNRRAAS